MEAHFLLFQVHEVLLAVEAPQSSFSLLLLRDLVLYLLHLHAAVLLLNLLLQLVSMRVDKAVGFQGANRFDFCPVLNQELLLSRYVYLDAIFNSDFASSYLPFVVVHFSKFSDLLHVVFDGLAKGSIDLLFNLLLLAFVVNLPVVVVAHIYALLVLPLAALLLVDLPFDHIV